MAGRKIRDGADARTSLAAAAESKVSRAEWARQQGIDGRSLNAWRLNLARREQEEMELATTCRALNVDTQAYLSWVLTRVGTHRDLYGLSAAELTPAAYARARDG